MTGGASAADTALGLRWSPAPVRGDLTDLTDVRRERGGGRDHHDH
jgi:hypothetical protein